MATSWGLKELLAKVKMNQLGIPKYSDAEQIAIIDSSRLAGMSNYNTDNKAFQIYQSGNGSTFSISELSNFFFRQDAQIGIGSVEQTIIDEETLNHKGFCNTRVFITLEFLAEVSQAGSVKARVTDGTTSVTVTESFSSNPTPVTTFHRFEVDTTSFAIDVKLNIQVLGTQVNIEHVEIRCI